MEKKGDNWYYYIDGKMQTGWVSYKDSWYYLQSNGVMATNWLKISEKWYFFGSDGKMQTGWVKWNEKTYYMNDKGVMQSGWVTVGGTSYYFEDGGRMYTGWLQQGSVHYYLKSNGAMAIGRTLIDGKAQKFDKNGKYLGEAKYMTSEDCVNLIKEEEGFSAKPYYDYGQYTVGYGTRCPDDKLDYYRTNGITVEEAEALLREYMIDTEDSIESFAIRSGLNLTANQFDSLVMFSYNCGTRWTTETNGTFYNAIVNGATGNDLIRAYGLWSTAGGSFLDGLIRRRLCEANMYLNGVYSKTAPENYCYVFYDVNGGNSVYRIQCFDSSLTTTPAETPTHQTMYFAGWYTAKEGGTKVTSLTSANNKKTLYARWSEIPLDQAPEETPAPNVNKNLVTVTNGPLNVRTGPGTGYSKVTGVQLANNTQVAILEVSKDSEGNPWGRYKDGWIHLGYTNYDPNTFNLVIGWVQVGEKWYFYDGNGVMQTGWKKINEKWYFFENNGVMAVNAWKKDSKGWCYLGDNGAMITNNWAQDSKGLCYIGADGYCLTNTWILHSKGWIWLNGEGSMTKSQWILYKDKWYYLDSTGYMATGWLQYKNRWYFLQTDGAMATGWLKDNGKWYYLDGDGIMQTGWLKLENRWYYLNQGGSMKTGWLQYKNNWYYLQDNGVMATGTITINGMKYRFDTSGVWLG